MVLKRFNMSLLAVSDFTVACSDDNNHRGTSGETVLEDSIPQETTLQETALKNLAI